MNDIVSTIMSPAYKPRSRDLGTDSDRVGLALVTFIKETEGSALAADAKELQGKFQTLEKLAATRPPLEKQREAARRASRDDRGGQSEDVGRFWLADIWVDRATSGLHPPRYFGDFLPISASL